MTAARQLFDERATLAAAPVARQSSGIVKNSMELVTRSRYPDLAQQIEARRHPAGKGGWLALPAVSAGLAILARLAACGDIACRSYEQTLRGDWSRLAAAAPHLVTIDLVLAELLLGARRTE